MIYLSVLLLHTLIYLKRFNFSPKKNSVTDDIPHLFLIYNQNKYTMITFRTISDKDSIQFNIL